MWKAVLAGTTALALIGSTFAFAQQERGNRAPRRGPSVEDMRAFGDARLAALRAGLSLTAEQQTHWPAFEQAARAMQQLRIDRTAARRQAARKRGDDGEKRAVDPAERMRRQAARMTESGAALTKLAEAMGPLYASLDDAQKRRFAVLSRMGGQRGGGFHRGRDGGPGPWQGRQRRTDATPDEGMPSAAPLVFGRKGDAGFHSKAPVGDGTILLRGKAPQLQGKASAEAL